MSVTVAVSIDTEEDNWGTYDRREPRLQNIRCLPRLQALFDKWSVRPTYLVNYPPLNETASVTILAEMARRDDIEIGTHCHPWNTPPHTPEGVDNSMMSAFPVDVNQAKIRTVGRAIATELGVEPSVFRAGRWSFGPSVAEAIFREGYEVDCSVTPFIDWSASGGPDFSGAPHRPYRFRPDAPLVPVEDGPLLQLPPTIGFLKGHQRRSAKVRAWLESTWLARRRVVGMLDLMGIIARRWLSPEVASGDTMVRLAEAWVDSGEEFIQVSFHSCTLLPGATPFVTTEADQQAFLDALDQLFDYFTASGFEFRTLSQAAERYRTTAPEIGERAS